MDDAPSDAAGVSDMDEEDATSVASLDIDEPDERAASVDGQDAPMNEDAAPMEVRQDAMATDDTAADEASIAEQVAADQVKAAQEKAQAQEKAKKNAGEMIKTYYFQLTSGCEVDGCENFLCKANVNSLVAQGILQLTANDAAALAVKLARQKEKYVCGSCPGCKIPDCIKSVLPVSAQDAIPSLEDALKLRLLRTAPSGALVVDVKIFREHCEKATATGDAGALIVFVKQVFSDSNTLNFSFLKKDEDTSAQSSGHDIAAIEQMYELMYSVQAEPVGEAVLGALSQLVRNLKDTVTLFEADAIVQMRQFFIMLLDPCLMEYAATEKSQGQVLHLFECITKLPGALSDIMSEWLKNLGADRFSMLTYVVQTYISVRIMSATVSEDHRVGLDTIFPAVKVLAMIHRANESTGWLQAAEFYNDAVNQMVNMRDDYRRWSYWDLRRHPRDGNAGDRDRFSFCNYGFILDAASKVPAAPAHLLPVDRW
jgi:hypothetical protein